MLAFLTILLLLICTCAVLVAVRGKVRSSRLPHIELDSTHTAPTKDQLTAISSVYERALTEGAAYLHTKSVAHDLLCEDEPDWESQATPIIEDCEEAIAYLDNIMAQTRWLTYDSHSFLAQTITMLSMLIRGHEQILRALQFRSVSDLEGSPDMDTISQLTARIHKARSYV